MKTVDDLRQKIAELELTRDRLLDSLDGVESHLAGLRSMLPEGDEV